MDGHERAAVSPDLEVSFENEERPKMRIPLKWCLMGIVFFYALATMTLFAGLMLVSVMVPVVTEIFAPALYARFRHKIVACGAGVGLVFAFLATFTGALRLNIFSLLMCAFGLLFIAFLGLRDRFTIKISDKVKEFIAFVEGDMFFYYVTGYFVVATMLIRNVYTSSAMIMGEFVTVTHSADMPTGRLIFFMLFTACLLAPPIALAYNVYVSKFIEIKPLLLVMGGTGILAVLALPFFFGAFIGIPVVYVILGFAGVSLVAYVMVSYKKIITPTIEDAYKSLKKAAGGLEAPVGQGLANESPLSEDRLHEPVPPSQFYGNIAGLVGIRIISVVLPGLAFLLMIPVLLFTGSVVLSLLMLLLAVHAMIAARAFCSFLLIRWEVINSEIAGFKLGFGATMGSYMIMRFKVALLTIGTLGLYALFGGAAASVIRWKIQHIVGGDGTPSEFSGNWQQLFIVWLGIGILRIASVPLILFLVTLFIGGGFGFEGMLLDPFDSAVGFFTRSIGAYLVAGFLIALSQLFLSALTHFYMMRFEIMGAYVASRQWRFKGQMSGLMSVYVLNGLLSIVTLGVYGMIGFPLLQYTLYKIRSIEVEN